MNSDKEKSEQDRFTDNMGFKNESTDSVEIISDAEQLPQPPE
jgi:hypothetical protein